MRQFPSLYFLDPTCGHQDHVSLKPLYCTLHTVVEQPNARSILLKQSSWLLSVSCFEIGKNIEKVVPIGVALGWDSRPVHMPCAPFAVSAINRWNAVGYP